MNIHWSKMCHSDSDTKQSPMKPRVFYLHHWMLFFSGLLLHVWIYSKCNLGCFTCRLCVDIWVIRVQMDVWHDCEMFAWHCVMIRSRLLRQRVICRCMRTFFSSVRCVSTTEGLLFSFSLRNLSEIVSIWYINTKLWFYLLI